MKIACLMGTYGRFTLASEALACFLQQTVTTGATLLIYNQHPLPLRFDHPRVRIVNETPPARSLRHIRQRMLELADPDADLIHFWDDDDLYLPWHLADCVAHIGASPAWKPASCWIAWHGGVFSREQNLFEGSWVFQSGVLRSAALDTHPTYTDHPAHLQLYEAGRLATTELGAATSYIYRWGTGKEHLSGYGADTHDNLQRRNVALWRARSTDVRADGRLVPADLSQCWADYLAATRPLLSKAEWELNRKRLPESPWPSEAARAGWPDRPIPAPDP
jgi:hypothetical protein